MIWTAILSAIAIATAHYLGLIGALKAVITKIMDCSMCSVFWGTVVVELYYGCELGKAILLGVSLSFLSNYFALVFIPLQRLYDRLWQKVK